VADERARTVDAIPAPVELDPARSAVIVVDMQNDFGSAGGMFDLAGIDISAIRAIIEPTRRLLAAARAAQVPIVYLKMAFTPDLGDAGAPDSPTWIKHMPLRAGQATTAPDGRPSRVLVRDTWNTDIVDELAPQPDDVIVYKNRYSGFFGTDLEGVLRKAGASTLVFAGATTSVCVESTVRDAVFRDFHCIVLEDCTAEPIGADLPRSNHDASLLVLKLLFGSISDSASVIAALQPHPPALSSHEHRADREG
jgi:ureidoacrylate peracid hydrolase